MHGVALHGLPISEVVIATCKKGASPTDPCPLYIILAALAGPCGSSSTPFVVKCDTVTKPQAGLLALTVQR